MSAHTKEQFDLFIRLFITFLFDNAAASDFASAVFHFLIETVIADLCSYVSFIYVPPSTKLYAAIYISLLPEFSLPSDENPHIDNTSSLSGFLSLLLWVYMPDTDPPTTHFHFYLALQNVLRFVSYLPSFIPKPTFFPVKQ